MANIADKLSDRFRSRRYAELVLKHQRRVSDEELEEETLALVEGVRRMLRENAGPIYEHFLLVPRTRLDFFEASTQRQYAEIVRTIKHHFFFKHRAIANADEALAIAHVVTLNFARLCNLNPTFHDYVSVSQRRNIFDWFDFPRIREQSWAYRP